MPDGQQGQRQQHQGGHPHQRLRQRHAQQGQQRKGQQDQPRVQPAGPPFPQQAGQRDAASRPVLHQIAGVVDQQHGRRMHARHDAEQQRQCRKPACLQKTAAADGHQPEEQQHHALAPRRMRQRSWPRRIEPAGQQRCQPDGNDHTPVQPRQHQSAQQGQTKAQPGRTAHFGHRGQATAHQPLRPQPLGSVNPPGAVARVVEQVGAGLNAQHAATGQQQRRQTGDCAQMDAQGRTQEDGNQ